MESEHNHPHPMPKGSHSMWNSWSSWSSPVGLGVFLFLAALAAAIVLYSLLNLAGAVISIAHPAASMTQYTDPSMQGAMPAAAPTGP